MEPKQKPLLNKCTVFEDNKGCLEIATDPKIGPRTRHIAIKFHNFLSRVMKKTINIKWVETSLQVVDQVTNTNTRKH
jgi:hypothetical protein